MPIAVGVAVKVSGDLLRLMTLLESTSWRHPRQRRYMQRSTLGASTVNVDLFLLAAVNRSICLHEIIDGARKKFGALKEEVATGTLCRSWLHQVRPQFVTALDSENERYKQHYNYLKL